MTNTISKLEDLKAWVEREKMICSFFYKLPFEQFCELVDYEGYKNERRPRRLEGQDDLVGDTDGQTRRGDRE